LKERVGAWLSEENCIAEGYRLTFDSRGYADIFQDKASKVYGVIYGLSEIQMKKLDNHEGVDKKIYKGVPISITSNKGLKKAITYVKVDKTPFTSPPD
jgi:gamma-glutamylcyclotransferase (GGCT)/AIG2-like uncharacterized protein YtfP